MLPRMNIVGVSMGANVPFGSDLKRCRAGRQDASPLNVTLAGTTVAYETFVSSVAGNGEVFQSEWYVFVLDLRSGRVLHKVPTGESRHPRPGAVGAGEATAIVVKNDGAVAWINDTVQNENRFEVHALDATGERVLAVGSNIAPNSLALAGTRCTGRRVASRLQRCWTEGSGS